MRGSARQGSIALTHQWIRLMRPLLCIALAMLPFLASATDKSPAGGGAAEQAVLAADSRYWQTFNACDLPAMASLLTDDVEFYHDKTGLTVTRQGVIDSLRKGPCADPSMHLRREEVPGSVRFHPLAGGFALLTGEHRFVVEKAGQEPYVDGQAEFAMVWQWTGGQWRIRRILSYDHAPVSYVPPTSNLMLTPQLASRCVGRYRTAKAGDLVVTAEGDHLQLVAGTLSVTLLPMSESRFFARERDLQFEFRPGASGRADGVTVYEHGAQVAVGTRVGAEE
jgi:hypothetical protein